LTAIRADQEKDYELGTPIALRAPEVILRAGYDCKIDIWAVGCMVSDSCGAAGCDILIMLQAFELLTGTWAFDPRGGSGFSADDEHLARMIELTGQTFSPAMLDRSELRDKFFNNDGEHNPCE
jgi:serine/threonine-protein kinase SRPK3